MPMSKRRGMNTKLGGLFLSAGGLFVARSAIGQNLVQNGGFEVAGSAGQPFADWTAPASGSNTNGSWSVTQDTTHPNSGLADALLGVQTTSGASIGTVGTSLTQNLGTVVPAVPYTFSFYAMGNFLNAHDAEYTIQYKVGPNTDSTAYIPFAVGGTTDSQGYVFDTSSFTFPAGTTTAGITFHLNNLDAAGASNLALNLDDVSFSVPEPTCTALISVASFGLLRRRRRTVALETRYSN